MLAGRIETCALIYLCVCECECVRVSNDRLRGLSARPLSLFSAHPRSQRRPPPWRAGPAPGHPGWRGSVFGTMRTLWCAGGGVGGHAVLIISAMPRGRWPWAPRAVGGAGGGLHCPASPPLRQEREGTQARALVSLAGPGNGKLPPLSGGSKGRHCPHCADTLVSTDVKSGGVRVDLSLPGPNAGSAAC